VPAANVKEGCHCYGPSMCKIVQQSWHPLDPNTASRVGDVPETTPGELIDGPALVIPSHTTSIVPTPTGSGVLGSGNGLTSGQGASAGGVLWGVTFMAAIAGLTLTLIS